MCRSTIWLFNRRKKSKKKKSWRAIEFNFFDRWRWKNRKNLMLIALNEFKHESRFTREHTRCTWWDKSAEIAGRSLDRDPVAWENYLSSFFLPLIYLRIIKSPSMSYATRAKDHPYRFVLFISTRRVRWCKKKKKRVLFGASIRIIKLLDEIAAAISSK